MVRRSWRNFDYLLFVALILLSAYGVTMIYSATINTLGIENTVERQIVYLAVGSLLLVLTASVDYRLLDIVQHPIPLLTPLGLGIGNAVLVFVQQTGQFSEEILVSPELLRPCLPAIGVGFLLILGIYLFDRTWVVKLSLVLGRAFVAVVLLGVLAAGIVLLRRLDLAWTSVFSSYLLTGGVALLYLLDCLTLRFGDRLCNPLFALVLAMLLVVFLIGHVSGGSQRWLGAGAVQPSEPAKILMIVVLARFLAHHEEQMEKFTTVLVSIGIIALPALLIYLQPDLGTALSLIAIWVAMIWTARIRLRHLLFLALAGLAALPLAWLNLEDYMRDRLMLFLNPASDPDSYFNVHQALVSIGSGGWVGKGLTQGTQSQLHFLRVRHTDFIFAVTAEELGFLGAVAMMALLFFLLWRILRVAARARDTFGRLLAAGIAGLILFQSVVNIGMNLGLMPVTGIPLPFVSYGGSSFLTLMLGIGLVESVAMRHKKLEFD
jgi:rod shape determining protein RodA